MSDISVTIDEITLPDSIDGPEARDFLDYVAVRNAVEAEVVGNDLLTMPAHELLPGFRSNPHRARRLFAARVNGAIVGRAMVKTRPQAAGSGADLVVDVLSSHRGHGIGAALLEIVENAGRDAGCRVLQCTVAHTVEPGGDRLASPTGWGDVPVRDAGVRFLCAHGYALEQVARISELRTAGLQERLAPLRTAALEAAGDSYRLHTWTGPTPAKWLDDLATLRTRMGTDAPMAGMQVGADVWDAERIVADDETHVAAGREVLTTAVQHVAAERLVGFSEIAVPSGRPVGQQEDTLVLREHRGRRLGMLLKSATAERLLQAAPAVEAIITFNAEENRPMLEVNEAMGFRPIGYEGAWQKRV